VHLRTSVARKVKSLAKDRRGQGLIEYALIILLVALAALTALIAFGGNNNNGILGPSVSAIANVEH
jgi:Flp pilus assembly pilin Flp